MRTSTPGIVWLVVFIVFVAILFLLLDMPGF